MPSNYHIIDLPTEAGFVVDTVFPNVNWTEAIFYLATACLQHVDFQYFSKDGV